MLVDDNIYRIEYRYRERDSIRIDYYPLGIAPPGETFNIRRDE